MTIKTLTAILFLVLTLTACSENVETVHYNQTLGKQLEDLKQAYDTGAITQKEYKDMKEVLVDRYNQ